MEQPREGLWQSCLKEPGKQLLRQKPGKLPGSLAIDGGTNCGLAGLLCGLSLLSFSDHWPCLPLAPFKQKPGEPG